MSIIAYCGYSYRGSFCSLDLCGLCCQMLKWPQGEGSGTLGGNQVPQSCNLLITQRLYPISPWDMHTSWSYKMEMNHSMFGPMTYACWSVWQRYAGKELECYSQHKTHMIYKIRK